MVTWIKFYRIDFFIFLIFPNHFIVLLFVITNKNKKNKNDLMLTRQDKKKLAHSNDELEPFLPKDSAKKNNLEPLAISAPLNGWIRQALLLEEINKAKKLLNLLAEEGAIDYKKTQKVNSAWLIYLLVTLGLSVYGMYAASHETMENNNKEHEFADYYDQLLAARFDPNAEIWHDWESLIVPDWGNQTCDQINIWRNCFVDNGFVGSNSVNSCLPQFCLDLANTLLSNYQQLLQKAKADLDAARNRDSLGTNLILIVSALAALFSFIHGVQALYDIGKEMVEKNKKMQLTKLANDVEYEFLAPIANRLNIPLNEGKITIGNFLHQLTLAEDKLTYNQRRIAAFLLGSKDPNSTLFGLFSFDQNREITKEILKRSDLLTYPKLC